MRSSVSSSPSASTRTLPVSTRTTSAPMPPPPAKVLIKEETVFPDAAWTPMADPESNRAENRRGHFAALWDQSGVTDAVLRYPYRGRGTAESPYEVDFLPDYDCHNPMTFSETKKWSITAFQAAATLAVAFVSTAYSGGITEIMAEFHVSGEIAILGISLFVVGFAVGPLLWAPMSEIYGRQMLFFITYMAVTAFSAGAAGAPNMRTLIVLRFFAGAFGSSPLTNSGGVLADMFRADQRGLATAVYATAPFLGPSIGPIASGFLGVGGGWRWIEGLMACFTALLWLIGTFAMPETYAPVLLRKRAAELSRRTGHVYVSKLDIGRPHKSIAQELKVALSRPWVLLFREPIVFLTAIYMAIIYGTLYMMFAAFPIVFGRGRGWSPGISGLAFVGVAIGMFGAVIYSIFDNRRYTRAAAAQGGAAAPEDRLPPALIGAVLVPVGLFWFAWTNGPEVHWVVPIIASGVFASGLVLVFLSMLNYLIDSYVVFAASVLAANTVMRSLFGAAFPLFTTQMYDNLGIHWASSIPAFLALVCVPMPFLFYRYGAAIRMRCKFAAEAASVLERMRSQARVIEEDEAMAQAREDARIQRAERVRSRDSRRLGEEIAVVAELIRERTREEQWRWSGIGPVEVGEPRLDDEMNEIDEDDKIAIDEDAKIAINEKTTYPRPRGGATATGAWL